MKNKAKKFLNNLDKTLEKNIPDYKNNKQKLINTIKEEFYQTTEITPKKTIKAKKQKKVKKYNGVSKRTIKKYYKIALTIIGIIIVLMSIIKIANKTNEVKYEYKYNYEEQIEVLYKIKIKIDFEENLIFNKYNIILNTTDTEKTLKHGKDKTIELNLKEGKHTITFTNEENKEIKKKVNINVKSNMNINYKISTHTDKIKVEKKSTYKDEEIEKDEIKIEYNSSSLIEKTYESSKEKLERSGFTNIVLKPKYDLTIRNKEQNNLVYKIEIDGKNEFEKGDVFNKNTKITIKYHTFQENNPKKIKPPYTTKESLKKDKDELIKKFEEAGFTNINTEKEFVATWSDHKTGEVYNATINNEEIVDKSAYDKDSYVLIKYYVATKTGGSDESLSYYYAKTAFEEYGKSIYKYGFKCHWVVGLINAEQSKDGTYYIKVEVTIENAFGNKYKTIAEGKVTGTDANPKVKDFYVSD